MSRTQTRKRKHNNALHPRMPAASEGHISELRRLMVESRDLEEVLDYFFSHLAEEQGFIRASRPLHDARLTSAIRFAVGHWFDCSAPVHSMLLRVKGQGLVHGGAIFAPDVLVQALFDTESRTLVCSAFRLTDAMGHFTRLVVPSDTVDWENARIASMARRQPAAEN